MVCLYVFIYFIFNLAGISRTAVFYEKIAVIEAVVEAKFVWAAGSFHGRNVGYRCFLLLWIIKIMYFDQPTEQAPN